MSSYVYEKRWPMYYVKGHFAIYKRNRWQDRSPMPAFFCEKPEHAMRGFAVTKKLFGEEAVQMISKEARVPFICAFNFMLGSRPL